MAPLNNTDHVLRHDVTVRDLYAVASVKLLNPITEMKSEVHRPKSVPAERIQHIWLAAPKGNIMMVHNTMSQAKYGFVTKMIPHMFQLLARTSIKIIGISQTSSMLQHWLTAFNFKKADDGSPH
jgi:hypothetical protein